MTKTLPGSADTAHQPFRRLRADRASHNLLLMPGSTPHARRDDHPQESWRARLRRTCDEDAELYDRARPGYPPELYDDLAELAGAHSGSRVLEVDCGTGQATAPLVDRGCRITAVEAGPHMAAIARSDLAGAPAVEVVTAEFESWPLHYERFDPETPPGLRPPAAALPEAAGRGLWASIADLINERYGGRVTKRYPIEMGVSRRR